MKLHPGIMMAISATLLACTSGSICVAQSNPARLVLAADSGWKFMVGDPSGAEAPAFVDTAWRSVDLPHDWSIESRPVEDSPTGGGEGFSELA